MILAPKLEIAHTFLLSLYFVLPPLAIIQAMWAGRSGFRAMRRSMRKLGAGALAAALLGLAVSVIYGVWLGGSVSPANVVLTCYWVAGLICILKILDQIFDYAARFSLGVGWGKWMAANRRPAAQAIRIGLLFVIGLPYMIAAATTYRPKIVRAADSAWQDLGSQPIQFVTTDGLTLHGIWIGVDAPPPGSRRSQWGHRTVILCPGVFSDNGIYLATAREFLADGYNVLTFDFRGHGQSDGQLISFGDHERMDVLGAVRWARISQPASAQKIVGVGIGTGAAALLAAAADLGDDGQALQSLVIVNGFDRFDVLAANAVNLYFMPPLRWVTLHIGVPMACVQTGADLCDFSPADAALAVAPRPILFIHGVHDRVIPFELGEKLYDSASAPKGHLWLDEDEDEPANNQNISAAAYHFVETVVPML